MRIELRQVAKQYGSSPVLDDVSLTLEPGNIVAVLGANGAGKTTFLRLLAGIAAPTKGNVLFDGEEFRRDRLDMRRRFYFLPDFPALFPNQTIIRNIAIILHLYEADLPEKEPQIVDLLREFDLLPLALRPVGSLSRGQMYKVALTALIAADPEVWMFDEPFASGMDPSGITALRRHILLAAKRGRTILYSTQILGIAENFSDQVCLFHKGKLRAFDSLRNLRSLVADKENVLEELFRQLREGDGK
jgi:ABC-type multidrug transport system ATPase subunit